MTVNGRLIYIVYNSRKVLIDVIIWNFVDDRWKSRTIKKAEHVSSHKMRFIKPITGQRRVNESVTTMQKLTKHQQNAKKKI